MSDLQPWPEVDPGPGEFIALAAARCVLAASAIVILLLAPEEPARHATLTYASLIVYVVYSAAILVVLYLAPSQAFLRVIPWADVVFAGYLVALTDATNSVFFFFFFFPILTAAFDKGFRTALAVTWSAVGVFVLACLIATPYDQSQEIDRVLIRPCALLVIGLLISHLGERQLSLRGRLGFLTALGAPGNPRVGARTLIEVKLAALCRFFDAEEGFLALAYNGKSKTHLFHHSVNAALPVARRTVTTSEATVRRFIGIEQPYSIHPEPPSRRAIQRLTSLLRLRAQPAGHESSTDALANLLEAGCIITAAYQQGEHTHGRLVLARHKAHFTSGDARFLRECGTALANVVAAASLTEELVGHAAEFERFNISRDLHDTTIQPFIGLRMAAHSMALEFRDEERAFARFRQLVELADQAIEDLRRYTRGLREGGGGSQESLRRALRRQASHLKRFYDVDVHVDVNDDATLEGHLVETVFHIACEGLNNVVRHTRSRFARVVVRSEHGNLVIEICNRLPQGMPVPNAFAPRSIGERVAALAGTTQVEPARSGYTVVRCSIPLDDRR